MIISVEQRHIDQALENYAMANKTHTWSSTCPIARAIIEFLPEAQQVSVTCVSARITRGPLLSRRIDLPDAAGAFVMTLDRALSMRSLGYDVTLPGPFVFELPL